MKNFLILFILIIVLPAFAFAQTVDHHLIGVVNKIENNRFYLDKSNGKNTVIVAPEITITRNGKSVTFREIKVGDTVDFAVGSQGELLSLKASTPFSIVTPLLIIAFVVVLIIIGVGIFLFIRQTQETLAEEQAVEAKH